MMSAPAAANIRAISTASSGVTPSSPTQSLAEMRTDIGLSAGQAARIAAKHLQRIAHAVLQAAAIFVGPRVRQRA